ncbi:hypothetical protein CYMTET_44647 [Cymbomonas tetramitiformis]|uniref:Uncharacterized protein n=1 Tax=Cymbomonas tetramitiformis TaxID=36881 RepID=A0AAE0EYV2_9CHLO|nr:hypothetical protein CYMTET_44647 [Cymbomonas tetramitiformis]
MSEATEVVDNDAQKCAQSASEHSRVAIRVGMKILLRKEGTDGVVAVAEREHAILVDSLPNAVVMGREPDLIEKDFSWTAPELRPQNILGMKRAWNACKSNPHCADSTATSSSAPVYHAVALKACDGVNDYELSRLCSRVQFLVRPRKADSLIEQDRTVKDFSWEIMNVSTGIDLMSTPVCNEESTRVDQLGDLVALCRDEWNPLKDKDENTYVLLNTEYVRKENPVDHITRQFVDSSERIEIRFELCEFIDRNECALSGDSNKRVRLATESAEL